MEKQRHGVKQQRRSFNTGGGQRGREERLGSLNSITQPLRKWEREGNGKFFTEEKKIKTLISGRVKSSILFSMAIVFEKFGVFSEA